mgnify:CR=1 FL=1
MGRWLFAASLNAYDSQTVPDYQKPLHRSPGYISPIGAMPTLAIPVNFGFEQTAFLDTPSTLLVILAYTFEIYFDFSGYSDMAMGLGPERQKYFETFEKHWSCSHFGKRTGTG